MIDPRNPMSEYLSDQGKRTQLLDYLVSMNECIYDLSTELLALDHGEESEGVHSATTARAVNAAMNLLGDLVMVHPMLSDIYRDFHTVALPSN